MRCEQVLLILEQIIAKLIPKGYVIHHVDGNPANNNPDNLFLCTRADHNEINRIMAALERGCDVT